MSRFAENTLVSVQRTRMEIEGLLEKHRATRTFTGVEAGRAFVGFEMADRRIQFELKLPLIESFAEATVRGRLQTVNQERQARDWEQACRSTWRALLLTIKAKFVSIESGIETVEEAFLAQVMVGNKRFYGLAKGHIEQSYRAGKMLPMLPAGDA